MVREASSCARSRALGMVLGGMTQRCASEKLGVNISTIRLWLARHKTGGSLEKKHGRGRNQNLQKLQKSLLQNLFPRNINQPGN